MLQLLIYAYSTGTFSSRKIAAQIADSIAFRVLAEGHKPSYRTLCRFRETHLDEFRRLFVQVVEVAREAKLLKMGTIAIDGRKVKANASKQKATSYERMQSEQIVVAAAVTQCANDNGQLLPVLNQAFENATMIPKRVLADAGDKNESDIAELKAMRIDAHIAVGREGSAAMTPKNQQPLTAAVRAKLKTESGRQRYGRRKHIVEPVFG